MGSYTSGTMNYGGTGSGLTTVGAVSAATAAASNAAGLTLGTNGVKKSTAQHQHDISFDPSVSTYYHNNPITLPIYRETLIPIETSAVTLDTATGQEVPSTAQHRSNYDAVVSRNQVAASAAATIEGATSSNNYTITRHFSRVTKGATGGTADESDRHHNHNHHHRDYELADREDDGDNFGSTINSNYTATRHLSRRPVMATSRVEVEIEEDSGASGAPSIDLNYPQQYEAKIN
jgi:hypothetical protein